VYIYIYIYIYILFCIMYIMCPPIESKCIKSLHACTCWPHHSCVAECVSPVCLLCAGWRSHCCCTILNKLLFTGPTRYPCFTLTGELSDIIHINHIFYTRANALLKEWKMSETKWKSPGSVLALCMHFEGSHKEIQIQLGASEEAMGWK